MIVENTKEYLALYYDDEFGTKHFIRKGGINGRDIDANFTINVFYADFFSIEQGKEVDLVGGYAFLQKDLKILKMNKFLACYTFVMFFYCIVIFIFTLIMMINLLYLILK